MNVTVTNKMGHRTMTFQLTPWKFHIELLAGEFDAAKYQQLDLPENPERYHIAFSPAWQSRHAAGAHGTNIRSDWLGDGASRMSLHLLLQPSDPNINETIVNTLQYWATVPSPVTQHPPRLDIYYGTGQMQKDFWGHISRFEYSALRTDVLGRIVTLEADVEFTENYP